MNRTCIILNPAARGERAGQLEVKLRALAPDADLKRTSASGDARLQAARAVEEGYRVIVAAGGDGTVNEVVNGIDGAHDRVTLGILPVGTVNVFALELGIPNSLEKAWEVVRRGRERRIDLARANGHYFVQLAGIGFDAQVVEKNDWGMKKLLGPLSYVLTAAQMMAQKPPRLTVRTETVEHEGAFVLLGNGRYYGGRFSMFPEADMEDGLLDVCVFEQMNPLALARYLQGVATGTHTKMDDVRYFKAARLSVTAEETVPVEVDGEMLGHLPCEFGLAQRALRVLAPERGGG
ncbi:MAG: diacylglycerol kinase family lipid kinase [Verrucomicrobium sp.]|nr:diacylglycerol kinase family lipid kinase [Verrucomicrobium sp.]